MVPTMLATFSTVGGKHDKDWLYLASWSRPLEDVDRQRMGIIGSELKTQGW